MKFKTTLITALVSILVSAGVQAADISTEKAAQIKLAINELVNEYAINRDNNNATGYANTFSEDGLLILYGERFSRDQLIERVENSNPSNVGMHHMSTGHINIVDENNATGIQYFTLYTGTKGEDHEEGAAVNITSFLVMGKYYDKYVRTEDGWKFAERTVEGIFRPGE